MKHLLIDFENVQPQNLDKLPTENTHIWLFIGVLHKMLPISLVQSLLRFGERVHLVQLQKTGKNALDFYLSYYLGQITATDPNAQIGILSRDGGYDVLVEHILKNHQAKGIVRLANIDEVQQVLYSPNKAVQQAANQAFAPCEIAFHQQLSTFLIHTLGYDMPVSGCREGSVTGNLITGDAGSLNIRDGKAEYVYPQ